MKIEHIALWSSDIERMRAFYETYFGAASNAKYENPAKGFASYFLSFPEGARLEIMQRRDVAAAVCDGTPSGYAHLAIAVGSEPAVDALTQRLAADGYAVLDGPRTTGDGYYESVIGDPDGNRIEITV